MPFSGLPIISRASIRSLLRRSTADDPTITVYHTAKYILSDILGREWVARHIEKRSEGVESFFRSAFSDGAEAALHVVRVISLAEMMVNLQHVHGYSECASQLKNPHQIESTYAELEVGKLLFLHGVRFEFNQPTKIKGQDFDLRIWCSNGREAVADTKCKEETGQPSANTIRNSLDRARGQLPAHQPGFVFIKVPRIWIEDEGYAASLNDIASNFMKGTGRVVSVKFYVTSVVSDSDSVWDVFAVQEVPTQRQDFGVGVSWNIFPNTTVENPDALLVSAGWFRLSKER
jgi:hypothetical protein